MPADELLWGVRAVLWGCVDKGREREGGEEGEGGLGGIAGGAGEWGSGGGMVDEVAA